MGFTGPFVAGIDPGYAGGAFGYSLSTPLLLARDIRSAGGFAGAYPDPTTRGRDVFTLPTLAVIFFSKDTSRDLRFPALVYGPMRQTITISVFSTQ